MKKPLDYHDRRRWQDEARAAGRVPECGREACTSTVGPQPWVNAGTPLLYCPACARRINEYNPGLCAPEAA